MNDLFTPAAEPAAISVSELNRQAKTLLERGLARIWVEGELSNLARPASGHLYFTLKDSGAQIRCAFFRQRQRGPTISFRDGDQVLAFGKVSLYEARGDYQLIVERMEAAGEGELRRRFELLKKKLAAEGLFDEALKRPLPALPRRIGVITSPTGAAVRDILSVLKRRFPAIPVVVYPAAVQGDGAPFELMAALKTAATRAECDVLIIGRGGGSLEDLWAFNSEELARAIRSSPIPVISAVGHEVDFTIADFVADLRAPTPSGAAELAVPDQAEWLRGLQGLTSRLSQRMRRQLEDRAQALDWLARRLAQGSPAATVARQTERLKNARSRLALAMRHDLSRRERRAEQLRARLQQRSPAARLEKRSWQLQSLRERLVRASREQLRHLQQRLAVTSRALDSVSPLATLDRGYAIVTAAASGKVLRRATDADVGSTVRAKLASGSVLATVTKSEPDKKDRSA
jgi:exodeoxyribonuclease VII large subunit